MNAPRPAPAVVIRLPLEGRPSVHADYLTEADEKRMQLWLQAHPELLQLLALVYEMRAA